MKKRNQTYAFIVVDAGVNPTKNMVMLGAVGATVCDVRFKIGT